MRWLQELVNRFNSVRRSTRLAHEVEHEVDQHIEFLIADLMAQGFTRPEARATALRKFGNVEAHKEATRDAWGGRMIIDLFEDVRVSIRTLRRLPGLSASIVITLALCVGVNTVISSAAYRLALRPLPFDEAERFVQVFNLFDNAGRFPDSRAGWSQYVDFSDRATLFDGFAISRRSTEIYDGLAVGVLEVSADYFQLLRVDPHLGRFFGPTEVLPERGSVVVISQSAWLEAFDGDRNVVGQEVRFLNEEPLTVVGVASREASALDAGVHFFVPYRVTPNSLDPARRYSASDLWARLGAGTADSDALAQLVAIEREAIATYGSARALTAWEANHTPFEIGRDNGLGTSFLLMQAGTILVVLLGSLNVVALLLSRTLQRGGELRIRYALGAGNSGVLRLLLAESLILVSAGAALSLLVSFAALAVVNEYIARLLPKVPSIELDWAVLAWTLGVVAALAALMTIVPILVWRRKRLVGAGHSSAGRAAAVRSSPVGGALVVSQLGITFVLLIGAGLLFRSFTNVLSVDPGFEPSESVVGWIDLREALDPGAFRELIATRQRIVQSLSELPGVGHVGFEGNVSTVGQFLQRDPITLRDGSSDAGRDVLAIVKHVGGDYFAAMGIPVIAGRPLRKGDEESFVPGRDSHTRYVVDQAFADQYLPGVEPLGTEMFWQGPPNTGEDWITVVGVAGRANFQGREARDGLPVLYQYREESPFTRFSVVMQTSRPAASVVAEAQSEIRAIDQRLFLHDAGSLADEFDLLHLGRDGATRLMLGYAVLSLLLSMIGVHGLLSYEVQKRRHEIGVRSALGATAGQVGAVVLRHTGTWITVGLFVGGGAAAWASALLESRLFEVARFDSVTYGVCASVLMGVAVFASWQPIRVALRTDPAETLRE